MCGGRAGYAGKEVGGLQLPAEIPDNQNWEGMTRAVTGEGERTSPGLRRPTHWKYSGGEMNTRTASTVGGVPGGWYWSLPREQVLRGWIAFVNNAQKQF